MTEYGICATIQLVVVILERWWTYVLKVNPYRPGAGTSPLYLAGREVDENEVNGMFEALVNKVPVSSVIYSGLRGVGKLYFLTDFRKLQRKKSIFANILRLKQGRTLYHR